MLSLGGALISEFPLGTFAAPQNFPIRNRIICGISIRSAGVGSCRIQWHAYHRPMRAGAESRGLRGPGNVTNKNSWGPNTLIKQGAKLVATWEDVWEELPADVRLALEPAADSESEAGQTASLFQEGDLPPHEKKILALLKADEATHNGELIEKLEP